jgi:azurin
MQWIASRERQERPKERRLFHSVFVTSIVNSVLLRPYRIPIVTAFVVYGFALGCCSRAVERPPKEIQMTGNDQMKFDVTAFDVKVGQKVSVTLKNVGSLPKEAMGHDFILLAKDTDVPKFVEAAMTHKETDYIPPDQKFRVLAKRNYSDQANRTRSPSWRRTCPGRTITSAFSPATTHPE